MSLKSELLFLFPGCYACCVTRSGSDPGTVTDTLSDYKARSVARFQSGSSLNPETDCHVTSSTEGHFVFVHMHVRHVRRFDSKDQGSKVKVSPVTTLTTEDSLMFTGCIKLSLTESEIPLCRASRLQNPEHLPPSRTHQTCVKRLRANEAVNRLDPRARPS